jgi:hypothetical protein
MMTSDCGGKAKASAADDCAFCHEQQYSEQH